MISYKKGEETKYKNYKVYNKAKSIIYNQYKNCGFSRENILKILNKMKKVNVYTEEQLKHLRDNYLSATTTRSDNDV